MHIPDGFLSGGICAGSFVLSFGALALAVRKAGRDLEEKQIPVLGVTAAFVFAAQMINFPIAVGVSGHFLGAFLASLLLGPLPACLVISLVLTIQCLLFADGGLTALGANILNLGIVGGIGGFALFSIVRKLFPNDRTGFLTSAGICAFCSVVLASAFCAVELALSGASPFGFVFPALTGVHALIGIGEAMVTTAVLSLVLNTRPDLVSAWRGPVSWMERKGESPCVAPPETL